MKKIMTIVLFLGIFITSSVTQAKDCNFFSSDWWESATPEQVENAISTGANLNDRDKYGGTPLMFAAAFNQNPAVIETLIKYGADVKYTTQMKAKDWTFKPTLRLAATYDVKSDSSLANVNIIGGGNYQITGERLHRFGVETVGAA